jgi:HlyD family secretion protein
MKTRRKLIYLVAIISATALIGATGWYFWVRPSGSLSVGWNSLVNPAAKASSGTLNASGTVETTVLSIAPESLGKVIEVNFQEGSLVKAGQVLVHLDDSTLKIERSIAAANLDIVKLSLQQFTNPLVIANLQNAIAQDKQAILDARQALDNHAYFMNDTEAVQNAHSRLILAEKSLEDARIAYEKIGGDPATDTTKAAAYQKYYLVKLAYDDASYVYQVWTGKSNPEQNDLRMANLDLANARLAEDQAFLDALNGASIPANATGAGIVRLQQARISLQAVQARLKLLDDQIGKMTVTAPVDGLVMTRSVDPGNVVNPGTELLSLARLNALTITVYIPAESLGKIKLGQIAIVSADSFPEETFNAAVAHISDQPEFIPRTSQTVSGKKSTVYAVQLALNDSARKLKPGMPADVSLIIK